MTGNAQSASSRQSRHQADRTWTHISRLKSLEVRMLLSFQRPLRPDGKVLPSLRTLPYRGGGGTDRAV